jgi:uncharacterized iron-regulated protein
MFACIPTHRSAEPDSLVVRVDFFERDALIAAEPETYYLKPHYVDYACVLVRLGRIKRSALRELLQTGFRFVSTRRKPRTRRLAAIASFLLAGLWSCASSPLVGTSGPTPVPESRFFDARAGQYVSFTRLVNAAASADVVFFGEQHDDPATHRAELALLAAIGARRANVVVSLEMFERDVQPSLDEYLAGRIVEAEFLNKTRPWTRYATDYRALVELARAHGWPVVAANVPRRFATAISRSGLSALDSLPPAERAFAARDLSCPRDTYFTRFANEMKGHSPTGGSAPSDTAAAAAAVARMYEAQCVKDETMGESIAAALRRAGSGAIVVHFNGAFHSDMGHGTAERALRRLPDVKSLLVTAVPVAEPSKADSSTFAGRADYVIVTRKPPAAKQ